MENIIILVIFDCFCNKHTSLLILRTPNIGNSIKFISKSVIRKGN